MPNGSGLTIRAMRVALRRSRLAIAIAASVCCVLGAAGCTNNSPSSTTTPLTITTLTATALPATTDTTPPSIATTGSVSTTNNNTTTTSTIAPVATSSSVVTAPGCGPFVSEVFDAAQQELQRLVSVTLDDLVADSSAADLSDDYYTRVDDVTAAASAGGCDAVALARVVLDRFAFLPTNGPAAVAAKSALVDDYAWRVTRSFPNQGRGNIVVASDFALPAIDISKITSCAEIGDARLGVLQTMMNALGGQTLDDYLANGESRGSDLVDQTAPARAAGVRFISAPMTEFLLGLTARAETIGCNDEDVARAELAGAGRLRAPNSAAGVFAADQLGLALLLLTGV